MAIRLFDLYRSGYARGNEDGRNGHRRRSALELRAFTVRTWMPFTDPDSYIQGYQDGYTAGYGLRLAMTQIEHLRD